MARITLETADRLGWPIIRNADGRDILVQTDWDYPGVASSFGWSLRATQYGNADPCDHAETDGTITCPDCGTPAGSFIADAGAWLADHAGATADDPGYFSEETDR